MPGGGSELDGMGLYFDEVFCADGATGGIDGQRASHVGATGVIRPSAWAVFKRHKC